MCIRAKLKYADFSWKSSIHSEIINQYLVKMCLLHVKISALKFEAVRELLLCWTRLVGHS